MTYVAAFWRTYCGDPAALAALPPDFFYDDPQYRAFLEETKRLVELCEPLRHVWDPPRGGSIGDPVFLESPPPPAARRLIERSSERQIA